MAYKILKDWSKSYKSYVTYVWSVTIIGLMFLFSVSVILLCYSYKTKTKNPELLNSHIVYWFWYSAFNKKNIGKTDRNFCTHSYFYTHSCYNHLLKCENFNAVVDLHSLSLSNNLVKYPEHLGTACRVDSKIADNSYNWKICLAFVF